MLEAIVARLIPTDENGPGARKHARRITSTARLPVRWRFTRGYAAGLAALDAYAQRERRAVRDAPGEGPGRGAERSGEERRHGFTPSSSAFFNLVRTHTIQGTFCDPYYGGNANFVGWDLIGYPGLRIAVSADEQRMGVTPKPNHKSAYDYAMFTKRGGGHGHQP